MHILNSFIAWWEDLNSSELGWLSSATAFRARQVMFFHSAHSKGQGLNQERLVARRLGRIEKRSRVVHQYFIGQ
jgi:hypothetical protein